MRIIYAMTAALVASASGASAQDPTVKSTLDQLHASAKPTGQKDLDTLQLAAAHRERSASAEERTNGLWQSWVVAICQGCGVRERQASKEDEEAVMARARARLSSPEQKREERPADTRASRIVIEPIAMLEDRKPAIVMAPRRGTAP